MLSGRGNNTGVNVQGVGDKSSFDNGLRGAGQGQTFYEMPQDVHVVGRNASKKKPAKFLVFLLKDKGKPPVLPAN